MTQINSITVRKKSVYGNDLIYPVCEKAKTFSSIAKTTTLRIGDIELIKKLGYEIMVKQEELSV
tara:strand:- start:6331 stop:6522 length:192 start_codon:yes stop_codon:yes gene_type:complete